MLTPTPQQLARQRQAGQDALRVAHALMADIAELDRKHATPLPHGLDTRTFRELRPGDEIQIRAGHRSGIPEEADGHWGQVAGHPRRTRVRVSVAGGRFLLDVHREQIYRLVKKVSRTG